MRASTAAASPSPPSPSCRRCACRRLFAASLLLAPAALPCSAAQLTVGPAKPENAGTSQFTFTLANSAPADEIPKRDSKTVVSVETPRYLLLIDLNDVEAVEESGYFRYKFYVRDLQPGSRNNSTYFLMNGRPVGNFPDQRMEVPFSVGGEEGKISLPIFSVNNSFLVGPTWTDPERVGLASTNRIDIHLTNQSNLSVSATFRKPALDEDYWQDKRLLIDDSDKIQTVQIPPGKSPQNTIVLELTPKPAKAFFSSIFSFAGRSIDDCNPAPGNPGAAVRPAAEGTRRWIDDCVKVNLEYHAKGGASQNLSLAIPLRFKPWPPLLLVAVILGCLPGLLIHALVNQKRFLVVLRQDLLLVASIAVVMELLSMFLVSFKSNFRIFGLDLDPFQLLPAALIGALIGLIGFDGSKRLAASLSGLVKPAGKVDP